MLSSNHTSPKSDMEHQKDLEMVHKPSLAAESQMWQSRVNDTLAMSALEEKSYVESSSSPYDATTGKQYPKPLTVDTNVGKMLPRLSSSVYYVHPSSDLGIVEHSHPKPPPIDTSVGRQRSKTPSGDFSLGLVSACLIVLGSLCCPYVIVHKVFRHFSFDFELFVLFLVIFFDLW